MTDAIAPSEQEAAFPACRSCGKPAKYQNYTERAYCGPECGACWDEDELPLPEPSVRRAIAAREIAEWTPWVGVPGTESNAEEVIAAWQRWAEAP